MAVGLLLLFCVTAGKAQAPSPEPSTRDSALVITSDVDLFWSAYDRIVEEEDHAKQLQLINTLYIEPGTEGLTKFMASRDYTDTMYVKLINAFPKFWTSVRANTLQAHTVRPRVAGYVARLKELFPEMKPAKIYYAIGGLNSGGTGEAGTVMMGTEVSAGDPSVDVSEFDSDWLAGVFKNQTTENLVVLAIHEYVHTQQAEYTDPEGVNVAAVALVEGSCDFISELVVGQPLPATYMKVGRERAGELRAAFLQDLYGTDFNRWVYNGGDTDLGAADLGYYVGYEISRRYYENTPDKRTAISSIIRSDWTDAKLLDSFIIASGYYTEEELTTARSLLKKE